MIAALVIVLLVLITLASVAFVVLLVLISKARASVEQHDIEVTRTLSQRYADVRSESSKAIVWEIPEVHTGESVAINANIPESIADTTSSIITPIDGTAVREVNVSTHEHITLPQVPADNIESLVKHAIVSENNKQH